MKIVADDKIPFLKGVFEPFADINYIPGAKITNADIKNADALIIRTRTKCNKDLLNNTTVKFIATATIGYDHIDTDYCKQKSIEWTNAPGCNSGSVQQYILAALFFIANKHQFSLPEKTIGIIGVGNVGKKVENFARKLGMKVLLNDPPRAKVEGNAHFVSLEEIIQKSDIITLHVPLTYEGPHKTFHLFNEFKLNKLPNHIFLINTSRGEVVDNAALKKHLTENKIAGCVLDVWENEPAFDKELLDMVDIGTPHIAGYSFDGKANGTAMSVKSVSKYLNLGLDSWYPDLSKFNENLTIDIVLKKYTKMKLIQQISNTIYSIKEDDIRLRENPDNFENLRGSYPVRREMFNYIIKIKNIDNETLKFLTNFNLKINAV